MVRYSTPARVLQHRRKISLQSQQMANETVTWDSEETLKPLGMFAQGSGAGVPRGL